MSDKDDYISRQAALKKLAVYIHLIDKTMGKGTLTDDDCMEAAKSVLGEDELPAVQPDHNAEVSKMEIIRCKDCKRQDTNNDFRSMWCHEIRTFVKPDEFCCWAKKRGEADDQ